LIFCHSPLHPQKFLGISLVHAKQEQKQSKAKRVSMFEVQLLSLFFSRWGSHTCALPLPTPPPPPKPKKKNFK